MTQGSNNTVSQLGLTRIAGNNDTAQVYDVTADIGDTWRLTLTLDEKNPELGTYTLSVLHTAYGLSNTSGSFNFSTLGTSTSISSQDGTFRLVRDDRTNTLTGTMRVGGRTATVTGTRYAMPADLSVLAGTYVYMQVVHELATAMPDYVYTSRSVTIPGTLRLNANGTGVVCELGVVTSAGKCDVPGYSTPLDALPVALTRNAMDGEVHLSTRPQGPGAAAQDLGTVRVQAGDRGPVLVMDFPSGKTLATAGSTAAVTYAVRQRELKARDVDGTWACSRSSFYTGSLYLADGKGKFGQSYDGAVDVAFEFNQGTFDGTKVSFDGLAGAVTSTAGGLLMMPLSASALVLVEVDTMPGSLTPLQTSLCYSQVQVVTQN